MDDPRSAKETEPQGPLWQQGEPLGEIGSKVLFENEQIRVW